MQTLEQCLKKLVLEGKITVETAIGKGLDPTQLGGSHSVAPPTLRVNAAPASPFSAPKSAHDDLDDLTPLNGFAFKP